MKIKNLTKIYKTEYELVKALNDMTLDFPQKGLVFIVGVSGSGKSTLMNMLSGVDKPTSGDVIVGDKNLFTQNKKQLFGYRNSYVGLIFQDYNLIEDINVYENIKLPLEFLGIKDYSVIDEVIKKVDIEDIKYSKVTEISSGQMQRVAIARALVKDSAMILADEPTGNLDSKNTKIVMDLLQEISKDRLVIVITHDDDAAHEYGDRIIAIEDGTILDDTTQNPSINEYDPNLEKSTDFKKPKVTLFQQLKFTKGFMRNSLARSLAIFIMLILIPVIGNVLSGYAFFDISTSYYSYQERYGSSYVQIANIKNGHEVNFKEEDEVLRVWDTYGDENLYELYAAYIPIATPEQEEAVAPGENEHDIYKPIIKNLVLDNNHKLSLKAGEFPELGSSKDLATIAITDYIEESYKFYTGEDLVYYDEDGELILGSFLEVAGVEYEIIGIVDTNYEDFIDADFTDPMIRLAFEENLSIYNAIYTSQTGYDYIRDHMAYFVEEVTYKVIPDDITIPSFEKTGYVLVRNATHPYYEGKYPRIKYGLHDSLNKAGLSNRYALVSMSLWEDFMELSQGKIQTVPSFSFVCSSTNRFSLSGYLTYVFDNRDLLNVYGVVGEVVLKEAQFETMLSRRSGCRYLFDKDYHNYQQVIENENIVNVSFDYAKSMWESTDSSKYVMYEFLITLLVIMAVFAYVINSMTLNIEKKKIGIKYSFGISKFPIIVPYLLETLLYIITGIVFSLLIVKVAYPYVATNLIYTSVEELIQYEFFYIANKNILLWDLIIYSIMGASLIIMILSICRKSPIEIIKDL